MLFSNMAVTKETIENGNLLLLRSRNRQWGEVGKEMLFFIVPPIELFVFVNS